MDFAAHGYSHVKTLASGEVAGLQPFLFTVGLMVGITPRGYTSRYCYPDAVSAIQALSSWDGDGDPPGPWIKQKGLGVDRPNPRFKGIEVVAA